MSNRKSNLFYAIMMALLMIFMTFPSDDPRVRGIRWQVILIMPVVTYMLGMFLDWSLKSLGRVCFKKMQPPQFRKPIYKISTYIMKRKADQATKSDDT
jgi:hypothetical protein